MGNTSSKPPFDSTKQPLRSDSTSEKPIKQDTKKPSLIARIQHHSLGRKTHYSDEELKKHTGKTNDELKAWAENAPGVGKNQKAGKIGMGPGSGGAATIGGDG